MEPNKKPEKRSQVNRRPRKKRKVYQEIEEIESYTPGHELDRKLNVYPVLRQAIQRIIFD